MEEKTTKTKKQGRRSREELEKELALYKGKSNSSEYLANQSRKNANRYARIDEELDAAISQINHERKQRAEKDIIAWIETYCVGVLLDSPPSQKCEQIIKEMLNASFSSTPVLLSLPRGSGKTCYVECLVAFLMSTGKKRFSVIVSQNASSATNILSDLFRLFTDADTPFAQDYPSVAYPFIKANGFFRRVQTYNDIPCAISKTTSRMVFARLQDKEGNPFPTSESIIETRGITSGVRGLKHGTMRPDIVILDDIQTDSDAQSQEQISKLLNMINKSILNLGGSNKVSVLQTGTPIEEDDLISKISNDKGWTTKKYPAILHYPKEWYKENHGLWNDYYKIFDEETVTGRNHQKSLDFYKANQKQMDEGSETLSPNRFCVEDGTISSIQFLLDKLHLIGNNAFQCEYMMKPKSVSIELKITPKDVSKNVADFQEDEIPDGCQLTTCSIDLNTSYGATMLIASFKTDSTCYIVKHKIFKLGIDQKLPDVQYDQQLYSKLCDIVRTIKSWNIPIDCLVIDGGGRNFQAVTSFAKQCQFKFSIPCCALLGRSSTSFNPLVKSRLRNAIGRTVLCGSESERTKKGSGEKWLLFDSDFYREQAQKSFLLESGSIGSTNLYQGDHTDFALQITNEKLLWKKQKEYGIEYHWKSFEPHDYLDTLSMARAIAENQNIFSSASLMTSDAQSKKQLLLQALSRKRKIKIV